MHNKYFQKSKVFVYPLLGIRRGMEYTPEETFLYWKDYYALTDRKFICLYKQRKTDAWAKFETLYLLQNSLFENYFQVSPTKHVYVFDVSSIGHDFNHIVRGRYSKLTELTKKVIIDFFGEEGLIANYVDAYLHPEHYHDAYAEVLNVDPELLYDVHELCDKPDLTKEELKIKKNNDLDIFNKKLLSLLRVK
jgi:hypothetical protein